MPQARGTLEQVIDTRELPTPTPVNPWAGAVYVDHTEHQRAKVNGKSSRVSSMMLTVEMQWQDPGFGKGGHSFNIKWVSENGTEHNIFNDIVPPGNGAVVRRTANIAHLFPSGNGCFGLNGVFVEIWTRTGLPGVQDHYRIKFDVTVDWTAV